MKNKITKQHQAEHSMNMDTNIVWIQFNIIYRKKNNQPVNVNTGVVDGLPCNELNTEYWISNV